MPINFNGKHIEWDECAFLFLFCPNNSGSTVLSQYIASQSNAYLPPFGNNEGQMAPIVKPMMRMDPWSTGRRFDWQFIRSYWESLAEQRMFVEGSPPNILRHEEIADTFGGDSTAFVSISHPYNQIASCMRRYGHKGSRQRLLRLTKKWVVRANAIREIRIKYPLFPFLSYEAFTHRPQSVNESLSLKLLPFHGNGKIGSSVIGIKDLSDRSIAFLEPNEIDEINCTLSNHTDMLNFFNYSLADSEETHKQLEGTSEEEFRVGRARRETWNKKIKI